MEKSGKSIEITRGQNVESQILSVKSDLTKHKRIISSVNLLALPDKGAKLKQKVNELETLLEGLTLEAETKPRRSGGAICVKDNSPIGSNRKKCSEASSRTKCDAVSEICERSSVTSQPCHGNSEITVSSEKRHIQVPKMKEDKVSATKSTFGSISQQNEQYSIKNKTDIKQTFAHRFDAELSSFDKLCAGAPKVDDTLKDLVNSPSFKNWRETEPIPRTKLTEAKPLIESSAAQRHPRDIYSSNYHGTLASLETVKKLHHSLCIYPDDAIDVSEPVSLKTPLLKHQIKALSWLVWRETQQPSGGILADDMGLGKTLTMISLILKQKEQKNYLSEKSDCSTCGTLIVCLASLVHQWAEEINKHCESKSLSVLLYHGPKREKDIKLMTSNDVVITTYHTLLSERKSFINDRKETGLCQLKWERIILDEAHTIKNNKSQMAQAVFSLTSFRKWCVTGTPIHNEFKDMYSLVKFLEFSPFDDEKKWKKLINDETESSDQRRNLLVKSILLRRTKQDVDRTGEPLIKMVKKYFNVCFIELSEAEQVVYDKLESRIQEVLNKFFNKPSKRLNATSTLLVLLLRLQQCCCHVSLLGEETEESVDDSLNDLSMNLSSLSIGDKSNASSSSSSESSLDSSFTEYLNSFPSDYHSKSTKLQKVFEKLDKIAEESGNQDKSVIVSQWVSLLNIVANHLKQDGINYHMIVGSTKAKDRQKACDDFNDNSDGCKIMLLSLKAGGVGLNLVGGSHLFLLDLHWNPALEQQACDRIHRVGQRKDVFIHKFVCKNTIEQKILDLQKRKSALASDVLHGAKKVSKGLSMEDFKSLFNLKI